MEFIPPTPGHIDLIANDDDDRGNAPVLDNPRKDSTGSLHLTQITQFIMACPSPRRPDLLAGACIHPNMRSARTDRSRDVDWPEPWRLGRSHSPVMRIKVTAIRPPKQTSTSNPGRRIRDW